MTCSTGCRNKLVDRHPHVFGEVKADTPGEVLRNWQALKAEEKKKRQQDAGEGGAQSKIIPNPCSPEFLRRCHP